MTIKRIGLALLALVLLAGCTSPQTSINALNPTVDAAAAVATITYRNGTVENVSQQEVEAYGQRLSDLGGQGTPPLGAALRLLVQRKLMLNLARVTDTVVTSEDVQRTVTNVTNSEFCSQAVPRTTNDDRAYLDQCAQQLGFNDGAEFRSFLVEELTIDEVARAEAPKDLYRVAHILADEDYTVAAPIYDRVRANPDRFDQIAREVSLDPGSRDLGGELPPFDAQGVTQTEPQQQLGAEFVSNTLALRDDFEREGDAISEPFLVETEVYTGWHIVRLLELQASNDIANQFRAAVYQRAEEAQPSELSEPDTGPVPLVGVVDIRVDLPTTETLPTPEVPLAETEIPEAEPVLPAATPPTEEPAASPGGSGTAPPGATATP